jgi:hypothetical protein
MGLIIAERGRRCQDCGRSGCRVFGDHVVELKGAAARTLHTHKRTAPGWAAVFFPVAPGPAPAGRASFAGQS